MSILRSIVINQKEIHNTCELYIVKPTRFILYNYSKLLPSWNGSPHSLIIFLLYSTVPLDNNCVQVQKEKKRLRQKFLRLGNIIQPILQRKQYLTEIIDPRDGKLVSSISGYIFFDSVTIIHKSLKMNYVSAKQCKLLYHPFQKTNIYPGLMISNARVNRVNNLIEANIF
ncbi:MAG: hypothetical protein JXR06_05375 [Candidatus Atelocyanobacterium thalassa]